MKVNEFSAPVGEFICRLKYASSSIEADVMDALEKRQCQKAFIERAQSTIWSLIVSRNDWLNHLQRAEAMSCGKSGHPSRRMRVSS